MQTKEKKTSLSHFKTNKNSDNEENQNRIVLEVHSGIK